MLASGGDIKIPAVQQPPAPAPGASDTKPSTKPRPLPPPDPNAEIAINSAVNTAHLANQNLQLGTPDRQLWPGHGGRRVGLDRPATFADPPAPLPQSQVDAIKKASDILYLRPGVPTQGYRDFRKARDTVIGLIGAKAAASTRRARTSSPPPSKRSTSVGSCSARPRPRWASSPTPASTRRRGACELTLMVPPDRSILDVVEEAGVGVLSSCAEGTCGTCQTAVLDGLPDHRDSVLTEEERQRGDRMMLCVSRSRTPRLVLDL